MASQCDGNHDRASTVLSQGTSRNHPAKVKTEAHITKYIEGLPAHEKLIRQTRGLGLRAAAKEIGISFSTLSRFENGIDCNMSSVLAILRWLGS